MNRRTTLIVTLGALVTAATAIVYAWQAEPSHAQQSEIPKTPETPKSSTSEPAPEAKKMPEAPMPAGVAQPQIQYDPQTLPAPVKQTLQEIFETAQSGDIDAMRPVLEQNELKPMVAGTHVDDPVAFWKRNSADGEGRDVLAAFVNILSTGFVKSGQGKDAIYVWPYLAEMDLTKLTPAQEVEFYRIVPADKALAMKKSGKYSYYRLGVSPTGVWQYFLQ
jgi:hypothetical protein